jgi:diketogulonate reductase-like aldo/keto reductase
MKYINTRDIRIPAIGLGTFSLQGQSCVDAIADAIDMGYRHIDTAQAYENEKEVGDGIKASGIDRKDLFVTTKVWYTHLKRQAFIDTVHSSLEKLQTDYVDLLLIHWPDENTPLEETLEAMQQVYDEGKTRLMGVSNFTLSMMQQARQQCDVVCNQVEYHPYLDQRHILDAVRNHGMFMTSYSPIGKGKVVQDETIKAIGEKYGKTPAQVTLRWHMQQDDVAAIPRSSSSERRKENLDIFDFELTEDDMQQIFALLANERMINPAWAPAWD